MPANINAYAVVDAITGQEYAHVIDDNDLPNEGLHNGRGAANIRPNGSQTLVIHIPPGNYNNDSPEALSNFIANRFNALTRQAIKSP